MFLSGNDVKALSDARTESNRVVWPRRDTLSVFLYLQHICGSANTALCHSRVIFGSALVPSKRTSAPLYFQGVIVIDCTLIHTAQCTSPARASVLNQRPTKMGYMRPRRGETIGRRHLSDNQIISRRNFTRISNERQRIK